MLAFSPKTLAVAATFLASLSPAVHACLTFTGSTSVGLAIAGHITANDNGIQTCSGDISKGDKNLNCIAGYSLNYDFSDNPAEGPMPITYCNPHNCYGIKIPLECTSSNACCGGNIPCICTSCHFSYNTFCG